MLNKSNNEPSKLIRNIQYKIVLHNSMNLLNVLINKNINIEKILNNEENIFYDQLLCNNESNEIKILDLKTDVRFMSSSFVKKYKFYDDVFFNSISFLELNNSLDKYEIIKKLYNKIINDKNKQKIFSFYLFQFRDMSYDEFEYEIELMLEEFKLFLNHFEFNEDEKEIINVFTQDKNLNSNIKFIGWIDYIV